MNDHFFIAVGEKALYFWRFVNFDVSQKNLVFQVPDLKLFGSVCNEQMWGERHFQDIEIDNEGAGFDHEKLFGCLYSVEGDGSFVAVANAGIPIIVCQVLNDEFLAYVYHLQHIFRH